MTYAEKRDRLIPLAVAHADYTVGKCGKNHDIEKAETWNIVYLSEMDRLAREAGLVSR